MSQHLAHMNIARLRFPVNSPEMADFMAGFDPINTEGESTPGFVWRLVGEVEKGVSEFDSRFGADVVITMSVWQSIEALRDFTYASGHLDYLRRRREWFEHNGITSSLVLWWIPVGQIPTIDEGAERLAFLDEHGPTPYAFTFRQPMPAPTPAATASAPQRADGSRRPTVQAHSGVYVPQSASLKDRGLVEPVHGVGVFVREPVE